MLGTSVVGNGWLLWCGEESPAPCLCWAGTLGLVPVARPVGVEVEGTCNPVEIGGELAFMATDVVSPNVTRGLDVPGLDTTLELMFGLEIRG